MADLPAAGRVVLVTGAGRGIGRAVALELAGRGYRVAAGARSTAEVEAVAAAIRSTGGAALALTGDLLLPETATAWVSQTERALGPVDVLVNNAGHAPSAKVEQTSDDELRRVLGIHVEAPFRLCRAVIAGMKTRGFGRIVNIASTAGLTGAAYISAYTAAKHALVGLTRALAAELAKAGITANAVCPGYVDSDMTRESARNVARKTGCTEEEAHSRLAAMNRGGRLIAPEEVARAVAFFAADGASGINGTCLLVDGGTTLA
jgi:NAD(P)-dependent dehydrogenase (short-subunit alcohol dehydrogenase family)